MPKYGHAFEHLVMQELIAYLGYSDRKKDLSYWHTYSDIEVDAILGYIGMSLFFIRQRKKEIGVHRIMGSTTNEVLSLLLTKFCAPLLVSFIFAVISIFFQTLHAAHSNPADAIRAE